VIGFRGCHWFLVLLAAGALPIAGAVRALADEAAKPAEIAPPLTLADLESMAAQSNPTLLQAAAAIDQTRGNQIQAGLYPNPQVGYLRTDASQSGQSRTQGVFVGQEFVTAKKRQKAQAVQSADVDRLSWQYQAQVQRVVNDVRIRYYDVLGAEQSVKLAGRLVDIAEKGAKTTEDLFEARQASRADVLQARIQLKTVRLTLREAGIRHRTAWKQLTHTVGVPGLPLTMVAGVIDGNVPERDFDAAYQELLAGSPQVRAAETRVGHARAELVSEQAQVTPNVTLQVVAQRDQVNQFNSVNTFVSVPVPVFNRNQGNIYHAQADIREAYQEVERTKLALRDSLAEAFQRYETARTQVESLRDEILPDAKESLDVTIAGYTNGEVSILQVLAARQTYFQNSLAYIQAWTEVRKVVTEIDGLLLTGALNPAELGTALQGTGLRQQSLLNQMQDSSTRQVLPAAIQAGSP
jgi:cobalt-zinc-cadmium efflux system outer membrane protein